MLRYIFLCSVVGFGAADASAITWDDIRTSALSNNHSIRAANASMEQADASVSASQSGFLPTVKASLSTDRTVDTRPPVSTTSTRAGITASQNLFAGFADQKAVQRAEADRLATIAARNETSVQQRSALRKLFDRGLYLQEAASLSKRIVERRTQNVRIVDLRYSSGLENKSSFLKTQAAQMQAEADQNLAAANLRIAKMETTKTSGRPVGDTEVFEGQLVRGEVNFPQVAHPSLLQAQAERTSAAAQVDEARSGWLPQLTADASAYRTGQDRTLDPGNHYSVGLTLTVPLYTPTQNPKYREATMNLTKADINLASVQSDLELTQSKAKVNLDDAKARVDIAQKINDAAKMQAEVYRQRYTLGLISFQDWDTAESDYIKADKEFLSAKQSYADALTDYETAFGRTLEDSTP